MPHLEPTQATNLASDIYLVQDKRQAKTFFKLYKEILNTPLKPTSNTLSAEVGSRLINTKDSFGVCCHGSGQFKDNIFLIFRGSTTANMGADWISNARIGLEIGESSRPVHLGFNHIFKSMIPQLLTFFKNLPKGQPIHTVHCVGHSLGGAIATLAADWVKKLGSVGQVKCYTFGAPRPATHLFAKHFTDKLGKENIYRVYHESDPVPMIPVFPFCHAPFGNMGYLIHTRRAFWPTDHMMGAYSKSINAKGRSWASLSPTGIHEPTETQMKAWLESNIRVEPQSTTTWEWVSWAFYYVIRKIVGLAIVAPMQAAFVGAITLADNIALLLKKGLDNSDNNDSGPSAGGSVIGSPGYWVERLMRKIMEILHWQPVINKKQLTQDFMQMALRRLIERSHHEATRAIQGLNG